ncbi:hypothetical protein [Lederbergia lenta]|uniref:hypothetical protein n=1 Tax=Lederbergia lenta TaxID=1467 RepID=UPI002040465D|nr:hypothetical protein [Lederbergia lenta]MCM3110045.1 hypothetical protein [Lederbergia lenta]
MTKYTASIELIITAETEMDFNLFKQRFNEMNIDNGRLALECGNKSQECKVDYVDSVNWKLLD